MSKIKKYFFQIDILIRSAADPSYCHKKTITSNKNDYIHPRIAIINGLPYEILAIKDAEQFSEGGYSWIKVKTDGINNEKLGHLMQKSFLSEGVQSGDEIFLAEQAFKIKNVEDIRGVRKIILEPICEECVDNKSSKERFEKLKKEYSFIKNLKN